MWVIEIIVQMYFLRELQSIIFLKGFIIWFGVGCTIWDLKLSWKMLFWMTF